MVLVGTRKQSNRYKFIWPPELPDDHLWILGTNHWNTRPGTRVGSFPRLADPQLSLCPSVPFFLILIDSISAYVYKVSIGKVF